MSQPSLDSSTAIRASDLATLPYRALLLATPVPLLVHRTDGQILLANERAIDLLQQDPALTPGVRLQQIIVTPDSASLDRDWQQLLPGTRLTIEISLCKQATQTTLLAELQSQAVAGEQGGVILSSVTNIGRARMAEKRLDDNLRFLQDFFDTIPCPAFYKDRAGIYLGCNNAFAMQIIGIAAPELIGHSLFDLPEIIPHALAQIYYQHDQKLFAEGGQQVYETKVKCADGMQRDFLFSKSTFADSDGAIAGLCGVMIDLTQKVTAEQALLSANAELQRLSELDPLTEIANRRQFDYAYPQLWQRHRVEGVPLTVMMVDIDQFKSYNDYYGHPAGDRCIRAVAKALSAQLVRQQDLVARYGGEEFALLLPGTSRDAAHAIGERIRAAIERLEIRHCPSQTAPHLTISIGFASAIPRASSKPEALVALADKALYASKRAGRNRVSEGMDLLPGL